MSARYLASWIIASSTLLVIAPAAAQVTPQDASATTADATSDREQPIVLDEATLAKLTLVAFEAARNDDVLTIDRYVANDLDVAVRSERGDTLLTVAAYHGSEKVVSRLLKAKGIDVDATGTMGLTALCAAAFKGYDVIARQLIEAGADVNFSNAAGQTALMFAALTGRESTVELLLAAGADPARLAADGQSAASLARGQGADELADRLQTAAEKRPVSSARAPGLEPLPAHARLVLDENWSSGDIDQRRWYVLRKKWGDGNHGVVPENVSIERDQVAGQPQNVLVCRAHGDQYDGSVVGLGGNKSRVGGVIVSKDFFASGRYEVVMKIGSTTRADGGPTEPTKPAGSVPAIWTYGYRYVEVGREPVKDFVATQPLYNPHMAAYGIGANEFWSEIDFPEYGKNGVFDRAMYNTFCQNRHDSQLFDVHETADGKYHTYVTQWRTELTPLPQVKDEQVVEHLGFWWICDKAIPFDLYLGNPLKRVGKDNYLLYSGKEATHWIDGEQIGRNTAFVPAMAAQLNLGIWLPQWAGPAAWAESQVSIASVKVWQFDDAGDVRGVLVDDLRDNFDAAGSPIDP